MSFRNCVFRERLAFGANCFHFCVVKQPRGTGQVSRRARGLACGASSIGWLFCAGPNSQSLDSLGRKLVFLVFLAPRRAIFISPRRLCIISPSSSSCRLLLLHHRLWPTSTSASRTISLQKQPLPTLLPSATLITK